MSQANDGGQNALAGFLFQILGSIDLAAEVFEPPSCHDGDIDATFAIVKLESHGQDVEIVSTETDVQKTRRLVQFKYSGNPGKYLIEPQDLIEILEGFRRSEAVALISDPLPTDFLLVTNQHLNDGAEAVITAGQNDQPCRQLDAIEETVNGKKKHKGRTRANNRQYRAILKRLKRESFDEERYHHKLAERAQAFGMLEAELPSAVNRLVGAFFRRATSAGNRRITASELDQELVGFTNPRRLTDCVVRQEVLRDIDAKKRLLQLPKEILSRAGLVHHPALASRALVILYGAGGTGKTVAACQIVEAALGSITQGRPPFGAIAPVRDITNSWMAELVSRWRNSSEPGHRCETTDIAIDRLIAATSGIRPVLLLAMDGVDEVGPRPEYHAIGHMLRIFHEEDEQCQVERRRPRAVLLVTCRDPMEVYSQWICLAGFRPKLDDTNCLRLNAFSDAELCQLADLVLDGSVALRIRRTAEISGHYSNSGAAVGNMPIRMASPQVFVALKHPGLWRIFSEELVGNEQHEVLDDDPTCLGKLCGSFVNWLCWKAEHRRDSVPQAITRLIVRSVASAFGDPGRAGRVKEDWLQPAQSAGCAELQADQVFREAESLGLVEKVDTLRWKWRHPFMCEHLANIRT